MLPLGCQGSVLPAWAAHSDKVRDLSMAHTSTDVSCPFFIVHLLVCLIQPVHSLISQECPDCKNGSIPEVQPTTGS